MENLIFWAVWRLGRLPDSMQSRRVIHLSTDWLMYFIKNTAIQIKFNAEVSIFGKKEQFSIWKFENDESFTFQLSCRFLQCLSCWNFTVHLHLRFLNWLPIQNDMGLTVVDRIFFSLALFLKVEFLVFDWVSKCLAGRKFCEWFLEVKTIFLQSHWGFLSVFPFHGL